MATGESASGAGVARGGRVPRWPDLLGDDATLTPVSYPLFTTADVVAALGPGARGALAALHRARRIVTIGRGLHVARPAGAPERWRPPPHEAGWLVAVARHGPDGAYLSGLTAAAWHGACTPPRGRVHVTVPRQTRDRYLDELGTLVVFHERRERTARTGSWFDDPTVADFHGPSIEWIDGDLCGFRITSRTQTLLDLLHSAVRTGDPETARAAARRLDRGVGFGEAASIARGQRRRTAVDRVMRLRAWL